MRLGDTLAAPAVAMALIAVSLLAGCSIGPPVVVVAPAPLLPALREAATAYREQGGGRVELLPGSAASFHTGPSMDGRVDLFLSAEPDSTDSLLARGALDPATARVLAWDALVAVVAKSRGPAPGNQYLLPDYARVAAPDTASTLAGRAVRQGLLTMGVWRVLTEKLLLVPTASEVLERVVRGDAGVGIALRSEASRHPGIEPGFALSEGTHDVLAYTGAVVAASPRAAKALRFLEFLSGPSGREILKRHGLSGV